MLDFALAHVLPMLMFRRLHLLSADCAYAYACAYALVKSSLYGRRKIRQACLRPGGVLPKYMGRGVRRASQNPYPVYE